MFNTLHLTVSGLAIAMEQAQKALLELVKAVILAFLAAAFVPFEAMRAVVCPAPSRVVDEHDMGDIEDVASLDQILGCSILDRHLEAPASSSLLDEVAPFELDGDAALSFAPLPVAPSPPFTRRLQSSPTSSTLSSLGELLPESHLAPRLFDEILHLPEDDLLGNDVEISSVMKWRKQVADESCAEDSIVLDLGEGDNFNLLVESASFTALRTASLDEEPNTVPTASTPAPFLAPPTFGPQKLPFEDFRAAMKAHSQDEKVRAAKEAEERRANVHTVLKEAAEQWLRKEKEARLLTAHVTIVRPPTLIPKVRPASWSSSSTTSSLPTLSRPSSSASAASSRLASVSRLALPLFRLPHAVSSARPASICKLPISARARRT